jgi:putative glutamine amidotransferase
LGELAGGTETFVNSHHHQAIEMIGNHLIATAWTSDGLVEGLEDSRPDHFTLGVQWHPEIGWQDNAFSKAIFAKFISIVKRSI